MNNENKPSNQPDFRSGDILVLLERKFPTKYEIHRGCIEQVKNLILTTDDKEFAERLVSSYNHYRQPPPPSNSTPYLMNHASCQTPVMGSTHLIVLKDWITPYNSVKKGSHAPAYYWAEKLGKTEDNFIKDFTDGYLDEWFKVYCP